MPKLTEAPWSMDSRTFSSCTVPMPGRTSTRSSSIQNAKSTSPVDSFGLYWAQRLTRLQSDCRHRSEILPGSMASCTIWCLIAVAKVGGWIQLPRRIPSSIRIPCTSTGCALFTRSGRILNCAGVGGCCVELLAGFFPLLSSLLDWLLLL